MLINDGYSRAHILQQVEQRFFTSPIKKIEKRTLQRFFSTFDNESRDYQSYIPVSKNLASYLACISIGGMSVMTEAVLPVAVRDAFQGSQGYNATHQYVLIEMDAKDPFSALRGAAEFLSSMVAMTYLGQRGVHFEWNQYGYVKLKRGVVGNVILNEQIVFQRNATTLTKKVIAQLKGQTENILTQFTPESTARLLSAINISALSRSSPRPENQLITLWSSIEVLLSDPPRGVPRVVHYVDMLTPCICIKYPRRYIVALFDELRRYYPKHIRSFFRRPEFSTGLDQYTSFTDLLYLQDMKPLHPAFCQPMTSNPLALYRLWKLEKNFGNRDALHSALTSHEERVRWQLYRIYRTRNHIVHSGKIPTF
jgi:hypothetical protein